MNPAFVVAALALVVATSLPSHAAAQQAGVKVAIANPVTIFNGLKEKQELVAQMDSENKTLEAERLRRTSAIHDLQTARDLLKSDSPQYAAANDKLVQASIEFEVWGRLQQGKMENIQKLKIKELYDKIIIAIGKVANSKGIDLVLADQRPELPDIDKITADQLRAVLGQRNVLYNSQLADISADVGALMDKEYTAPSK